MIGSEGEGDGQRGKVIESEGEGEGDRVRGPASPGNSRGKDSPASLPSPQCGNLLPALWSQPWLVLNTQGAFKTTDTGHPSASSFGHIPGGPPQVCKNPQMVLYVGRVKDPG